jgi:formylglycine-generating enzyme required for sulfatase activity
MTSEQIEQFCILDSKIQDIKIECRPIQQAGMMPGEKKRVHRGGSFLCTEQYCSRYRVGTRGKGEVSTGTNHLGFRLVKSTGVAARESGR